MGRRPTRMALVALGLVGTVFGGYRIAMWHSASREPLSAIVVLGGGVQREIAAAKLSSQLSNLPVIVSSGSLLPCLYHIFTVEYGVPWDRITANYRATDTLTNFTSTLPLLDARGYKNVVVVTSERQIPRVNVLGTIVFGSQGVAFMMAAVPGGSQQEASSKTFLDTLRALGWVVLGDRFAQRFYQSKEYEMSQISQRKAPCEVGGLVQIPDGITLPPSS